MNCILEAMGQIEIPITGARPVRGIISPLDFAKNDALSAGALNSTKLFRSPGRSAVPANDRRAKIVAYIKSGRPTSKQIASRLRVPRSTVEKDLRLLRTTGVIKCYPDGSVRKIGQAERVYFL